MTSDPRWHDFFSDCLAIYNGRGEESMRRPLSIREDLQEQHAFFHLIRRVRLMQRQKNFYHTRPGIQIRKKRRHESLFWPSRSDNGAEGGGSLMNSDKEEIHDNMPAVGAEGNPVARRRGASITDPIACTLGP